MPNPRAAQAVRADDAGAQTYLRTGTRFSTMANST
jgi:hypothetical protein